MKQRDINQILQEIKRYCSLEWVMEIQEICRMLAQNRIEAKRLPRTEVAQKRMYEGMSKTIDKIIEKATKYREYLDSKSI